MLIYVMCPWSLAIYKILIMKYELCFNKFHLHNVLFNKTEFMEESLRIHNLQVQYPEGNGLQMCLSNI